MMTDPRKPVTSTDPYQRIEFAGVLWLSCKPRQRSHWCEEMPRDQTLWYINKVLGARFLGGNNLFILFKIPWYCLLQQWQGHLLKRKSTLPIEKWTSKALTMERLSSFNPHHPNSHLLQRKDSCGRLTSRSYLWFRNFWDYVDTDTVHAQNPSHHARGLYDGLLG
jgi:hypothetical protein